MQNKTENYLSDVLSSLLEGMKASVKTLRKGKSARVNKILAELVQWREAMVDVPISVCNKIWKAGEWQFPRTQSL